MLQDFWIIEVQVIPVVLCLILLEIPNILRAVFPLPYVPVYFALFPLNVLNQDLSIYLNEDTFFRRGENLTEAELRNYKRIIFQKAALSLIISLGLIPFIGGFLTSFVLPISSILGFCLIFIAYKLIGIIRAAIDFRFHSIANFKSMSLFVIVYIVYFVVFLTLFLKSFNWAYPYIEKHNWTGLFYGLLDLFIVDFLFMTILVGGLAGILLTQITNRRFRHEHPTESLEDTSE